MVMILLSLVFLKQALLNIMQASLTLTGLIGGVLEAQVATGGGSLDIAVSLPSEPMDLATVSVTEPIHIRGALARALGLGLGA